MKTIRTIAPCVIAGREVRAGLCLSLEADQADALIDAGVAEPWVPPPRGAAPAPAPAAEPTE